VVTAEAVSEVLAVTPLPPTPPAAPTNLIATLQAGPQVSLAWVDNADNEDGFLVERSDNGAPFVQIATVPAIQPNTGTGNVTYVDATVLAGNTYDYRVAAYNASGPSVGYATLAAPVTIPGGPQPPVAPDGLELVYEALPPDPGVPVIHLTWVDQSLDENGFMIQRSTDGGAFADLATVVPNGQAYDDYAVFGAYTYTYRVAAFNANGVSAWTDWTLPTASVTVPVDATPPAAPSNLAASNVARTTLTLTWQDNSNNETGFVLQRATNSGFTRNLVTIPVGPGAGVGTLISYNDTGLKRNTKYFYRVQAVNNYNGGAGPFPWSNVINVTTVR
jgi:titin